MFLSFGFYLAPGCLVMLQPVVVAILVSGLAALQTHPHTKGARGSARPVDALPLQVALDRAGFSSGVLDGRMGANTKKALAVFQAQGSGTMPPAVEAVTRYRITAEDAAGPYAPIPHDMMQQAALPALGYQSLLEALSERFHAAPALLKQLNPRAAFAPDDEIVVPNVEAMVLPPAKQTAAPRSPAERRGETSAAASRNAIKPDVVVTVSKSTSALTLTDAAGRVVFYAPVTTGSQHDPLPIGEWKLNGVQFNPTFRYNPDLFWDADPSHTKATLQAGPNNPAGVVWMDISREHYGLHGTPEPSTIGRTESHGCVRLTNWDALKVAGLVKPGTRVIFEE